MSRVEVSTTVPLRYHFHMTHRLAIYGDESEEIKSYPERLDERKRKWREENPGKRPGKDQQRRWNTSPAGYAYFNPHIIPDDSIITPPSKRLIAFLDVSVSNGYVEVGYLAVRPDHRGEGLARELMQAAYDEWPDAKVHWGKLMSAAMGHLYEWFSEHEGGRTVGGSRYYSKTGADKPQWRVNGKPYYADTWIEVEHDTWYRGTAHPNIPAAFVVKRDGDKWAWEARALTFIGAPHENRAGAKGPAKGTAKTLEQAQERALKSLTKDQEFFDRYEERMRSKTSVVASGHLPGGLPAVVAAPKPLPTGDRVFYRVHNHNRPWTMRDAWSAPVSFPFNEKTKDYEPKWDRSRKQKGYSCFPDPWHLLHYVMEQGWDDRVKTEMDVYEFIGDPTGEKGPDGEPLVIPDFKAQPKPQIITWTEFMRRIKVTPRGSAPTWQGLVQLPRHPSLWDQEAKAILEGKNPLSVSPDRFHRNGFLTAYYGTNVRNWERDKAKGTLTPFTKAEAAECLDAAAKRFGLSKAEIKRHMQPGGDEWFKGKVMTEVTDHQAWALGKAQSGSGWISWLAAAVDHALRYKYMEESGDRQFRFYDNPLAAERRYDRWFRDQNFGMRENHYQTIQTYITKDLGLTPVLLTLKVPTDKIKNWDLRNAEDWDTRRNYDDRNIEFEGGCKTSWVTKVEELPVLWERWSMRHQAIEDYMGGHMAPSSADDVAAPLHDVEEMMPDYYTRPDLYRHDRGQVDRECKQVILACRGKPDAMVTIYRALPKGYTTINKGDWVTISLAYARGHAMQTDNPAEDWPVISARVHAKDLWTEGYAAEWGYSGPSIPAKTARANGHLPGGRPVVAASSRAGIEVEDVRVGPAPGASGVVSSNGQQLAYRGFGSWNEARDAVKHNGWMSEGMFTVRGEGATQMALRLGDVLRASGLHTLRGTGFLGAIEADVSGLHFKTHISPGFPDHKTFVVNPKDGTGLIKPDLGLGIGIDEPIPLDRIKRVFRIEDEKVVQTWTSWQAFASELDSLEDHPDWHPEVNTDRWTHRQWVGWQVPTSAKWTFHGLKDDQYTTWCGKSGPDFNSKARVSYRQIKDGITTDVAPLKADFKEKPAKRLTPCERCFPTMDRPWAKQAIQTTAEADTTGVMICLKPSQEAVDALVSLDEWDEDPEQAHITLMYLGSTEDAGGPMGRERIYRALYDFGVHSGYLGLTGKVQGFGAFLNGEENVSVALWDIPGLSEFRTNLKTKLEEHGTYINEDHDFTAHTTLAYHDGPPELPKALPDDNPGKVHFTSIYLAWGEEPWQEVKLGVGHQEPVVASGHLPGGVTAQVRR